MTKDQKKELWSAYNKMTVALSLLDDEIDWAHQDNLANRNSRGRLYNEIQAGRDKLGEVYRQLEQILMPKNFLGPVVRPRKARTKLKPEVAKVIANAHKLNEILVELDQL